MSNKISEAKEILERLLGGVVRESGFTRSMTDDEIERLTVKYGYLWDGECWNNVELNRRITDAEAQLGRKLTADEIWGYR